MLAKTGNLDPIARACGVQDETDHRASEIADFENWLVYRLMPNRETKSHEWLKKRSIFSYLPTYRTWRCTWTGRRQWSNHAVMPGLLFVPAVMTWIDWFERALDWAHVHGTMKGPGGGAVELKLSHIETIMRIEAKLNKPDNPVDAKGVEIRVGDRVQFIDRRNEQVFGEPVVFEVAGYNRIGVEANGLFGGSVKVFVPSAEIVVM